MARGAGEIAVAQRIDRSVNTGPLAVPKRKHTIAFSREEPDLLGAPDSSGRKIFIESRPEHDVVISNGRSPVSGDEACGVQACYSVPLALEHRQPHEGLRPAHKSNSSL